MTGATPAWVERDLRIDPNALPARYHVQLGGAAPDASVYIDRGGVVVKRRLCGLALTMSLPLTAYDGIAVRLTAGVAGDLTASLELAHRDPDLSLPLAAGRSVEDAANDWRRWCETLRLPMLIVEADGRVTRLGHGLHLSAGCPHPRRRNRLLTGRRPRFLVRRRAGAVGPLPVLSGWREIIARN